MYYQLKQNKDGSYAFDFVAESKEKLIKLEKVKGSVQDVLEKIDGYNATFKKFVPNDPIELMEGIYHKDNIPEPIYNIYPIVSDDGHTFRAMTDAELQPYKEKHEKYKKNLEYGAIDVETGKQFTYFEYDGHKFSLSQNAQINWGELATLDNKGWFGDSQAISTYENGEYELQKENLDAFLQAYAQAKINILSQSRTKKQAL